MHRFRVKIEVLKRHERSENTESFFAPFRSKFSGEEICYLLIDAQLYSEQKNDLQSKVKIFFYKIIFAAKKIAASRRIYSTIVLSCRWKSKAIDFVE